MKPPEAIVPISLIPFWGSGCRGVFEILLDAECFETIGLEGRMGVRWGRGSWLRAPRALASIARS